MGDRRLGGEGGGCGDGELADVVSADVGGGLAVDEGLMSEEGDGVASGGVSLLGGGEDAVGHITEDRLLPASPGRRRYSGRPIRAISLGWAQMEIQGGEPTAHAAGVLGEHGAEGAEGGGGHGAIVVVAGE